MNHVFKRAYQNDLSFESVGRWLKEPKGSPKGAPIDSRAELAQAMQQLRTLEKYRKS
jgi:hypothetical protein